MQFLVPTPKDVVFYIPTVSNINGTTNAILCVFGTKLKSLGSFKNWIVLSRTKSVINSFAVLQISYLFMLYHGRAKLCLLYLTCKHFVLRIIIVSAIIVHVFVDCQ